MTTRCRSSSRHRAKDAVDGAPPALRHPGHVRAMAIAQTEFALKLYKALSAQSGRLANFHFSPLRVHHALTMVYAGSRYETAEQLRTALCLRSVDGDAAVSLAYGDVTRSFAATGSHPSPVSPRTTQLHLATRLYVPLTHCGLLDQYVTSLRQHYGSDVAKVPFHTDRERACREIDQWVEESTEQTVRDLVETPLATFVSLVSASVVYFRSPWDKSFASGKAELADFHNGPDDVVRVMTFKSRGNFRHGVVESVGCRIAEVRFADERYSLLLVQPSSDDRTLDAVEDELTVDVLLHLDEHLERSRVKVSVPRFRVDDGSLSLGKALADERLLAPCGIAAAFARGKVNLSGISGNNNLHLSHVVHKVRFEMDHFRRTKVPKPVDETKEQRRRQQSSPRPPSPAAKTTERPPVENNGPSANGEQAAEPSTGAETLSKKKKKNSKATDGKKENPSKRAARRNSSRYLEFNRPFMYAVKDRHLGMLLLLGCVRKLTATTASTSGD